VEVTPALKAALAELYFRESCDQQGFAYALPAGIIDFKNMAFQKGRHSISVRMHEQVAAEIRESARIFDYVAYRAGQKDRYEPTVANPLALFWVKTRPGFTNAQLDALAKTRLQVAVFKIRDVLAAPSKIETKWEIKDAKEWLDEMDERREEAESDDDYL
jgi:hypothetical protein